MRRSAGEIEEARSILERAIEHQRAALASDPDHPTYRLFLRNHYRGMFETLIRQGEHASAMAVLSETHPESALDYRVAATYVASCVSLAEKDTNLPEDERRRLAESYTLTARELLDEAVDRIPVNAGALNGMARYSLDDSRRVLRDPARAVELAEKAVELAPQESKFRSTLG